MIHSWGKKVSKPDHPQIRNAAVNYHQKANVFKNQVGFIGAAFSICVSLEYYQHLIQIS